ncbi:MAG: DEAD/DEAH box helicase [bacterium]|nr:DEAD/DEAH box helicase [bacterium]
MASSRPSNSDPLAPNRSTAFDLLAELVRRWVWQQQWTELRDAQERAIAPILGGREDVIVAAATAAGKTEAAFLPICSALSRNSDGGIHALYIGPLKALINDQFGRLESLCRDLQIPVHRWHGDVSQAARRRLLQSPAGILLITPESLEAQFILRGPRLRSLFAPLRWVVVDELHAFIGTERGRQLQSLLHRLELVRGAHVPRVALSATLGDLALAADFLRPRHGKHVVQIVANSDTRELRVQIRGYRRADDESEDADLAVARHLFRALRGSDNLVFANSRSNVEKFADVLRRLSEHERVPNEFLPHHGSLSKALREDVEAALKDRTLPLTAVCTNTLELGIDIGSVASVAQLGPPASVAATRQRVGRSGRRGEPAVLRIYVQEPAFEPTIDVEAALRVQLLQAIAVIELLVDGWCEAPRSGALHLSTLVQQILSLVAQCGGVRADDAFRVLCSGGPFGTVGSDAFAALLRGLGARDILTQTHDGTLTFGLTGERMVGRWDFYAAFSTPDEYRIVAGNQTLGTLPILHPIKEKDLLIFAGRRWRVVSVDVSTSTLFVVPAPGGRIPPFDGDGPPIDSTLRRRMRSVYERADVPAFLDLPARDLLSEGRTTFVRLGLLDRDVVIDGQDLVLFPWSGDLVHDTLALLLASSGFRARGSRAAVRVEGMTLAKLRQWQTTALRSPPPSAMDLASAVPNKLREKHDHLLPERLLLADYATTCIDVDGAMASLRTLRIPLETDALPSTS